MSEALPCALASPRSITALVGALPVASAQGTSGHSASSPRDLLLLWVSHLPGNSPPLEKKCLLNTGWCQHSRPGDPKGIPKGIPDPSLSPPAPSMLPACCREFPPGLLESALHPHSAAGTNTVSPQWIRFQMYGDAVINNFQIVF